MQVFGFTAGLGPYAVRIARNSVFGKQAGRPSFNSHGISGEEKQKEIKKLTGTGNHIGFIINRFFQPMNEMSETSLAPQKFELLHVISVNSYHKNQSRSKTSQIEFRIVRCSISDGSIGCPLAFGVGNTLSGRAKPVSRCVLSGQCFVTLDFHVND